MRKFQLLHTTVRGYRPSIRLGRHGHPMRDEQGHGTPTPTPQASGDNTAGNSGGTGAESSGTNNGGQEFDLSAFWAGPGEGSSASPRKGESAESGESSSGQQQQSGQGEQQTNPVQQLATDIGGLTFENPMTREAMDQLSEGNIEGFQAGINKLGQQAVQQAIRLMLPILGQVRDGLRSEIQGGIQTNNTSRENEAALSKAFPAYSNPATRPQIEQVFNQAMKHMGNDRTKAIALAKDMLRLQVQTLESDVDLPPRTSGDGFGGPSRNINWADELLGRS